ncbi:MAG: HD domain-containing protein [Lachnospiraceae bacterium]|nr:HD domain-containing protein [Lachnospiraceae bacterium]
MITRKTYKIAIFIVLMILINYFGKVIAAYYSLPIWMDSIGTVYAAYVCDPFCGAIVGLAGNIMYGIKDTTSFIYGITSVAIGVSVGIAAKKNLFDSLFGTLTASVIVTLFSVMISTPLNILLFDGKVGNIWGDGVYSYLLEQDVNHIFAASIGEFYVDFLDKVITLLILYLSIKFYRFRNKKNISAAIIPIALLCGIGMNGLTVNAENSDFENNIQIVYSSENGLPCGEANDVIQTSDGILWVGTYAGLYRYNGSEFRFMSNYDSVRNVNCLYLDEEGRLWIGTNDNGLSIAINEKITNVVDESDGLPANSVRCITRSTNGNYYIGTTSSLQIMTLDGGLGMVKELEEIVYAHSITSNDEGEIVTVTNDGDMYLINGESIISRAKLNAEQEIYTCATFDKSGMLYVGTSSGNIYYYDVSADKFEKKGVISCKELNTINRVFFTDDNLMYICSDNGIGYVDSFNKFVMINTGSFNNSIDNMDVDYQGNLWFSSSRLGLLKLSKSPFTDLFLSAGLSGKVVNAVTMWNDNLYVGTDNGLVIINSKTNIPVEDELTEQLKDIRIRCLMVDSDESLWICTYGKGIWHVQKDGEITTFDSTEEQFGDWARVIIQLSNGNIVASCDTCVGFFEGNILTKTIPYESGLSKAMILCLAELSDGRILCGTDGDGIAVIKDGEVIGRYTDNDGLSSDVILRIVEDPVEKGAYIVTSNGLCYMDRYDNISMLDNFPYYNNYDVWPFDDGRLFVLSSAGIYVTDRSEIINSLDKPEYELLDTKKGLNASLTANSWDYLDDKGNLYLSCDNGVYRMNIDDYSVTRKSYRMMISSVYLDNEAHTIERGEPLYVSRDTSKIEIIPEVINYTVDDPNVEYYLEGFDTPITTLPQSELTSIVYTNVPSGKYKFHLCVLDDKNENVIEESVFEIIKEDEIYDTTWFHMYMLIVAMLAIIWFTWFIARTQIQRTINYQRKELEFARNQLRMGNETILAIAKTVDAKDENTSQHSQRVSDYSVLIAKELGFSEEECENLRKAALLHDIGKIGIPDRVLNKPGKLTDEEYEIMKSHVTRGAEILKDFTLVEHAIDGTLYHHEKYDGTGYPQGLSGEDIPLYGRIIGMADAFDAMTANRVYRKKLDFDYVLSEIKRCKGTQFDPQMVDIMLKLIEDGKIDVDALYNNSNSQKVTKADNKQSNNNDKESES